MHVDTVLALLISAGITLNFKKYEFFKASVNYLGLGVTPGCLHVNMKCKSVLVDAVYPRTQTELHIFIGICNVYRRLLQDFAKVESPLTRILKKGVNNQLTPPDDKQKKSFEALKKLF